jgi:hypothetical protein
LRAVSLLERMVLLEGRRDLEHRLNGAYNNLGAIQLDLGEVAGAVGAFDQCRLSRERQVFEEGRNEMRSPLALAYDNLALALLLCREFERARQTLDSSLELRRPLAADGTAAEQVRLVKSLVLGAELAFAQADLETGGHCLREAHEVLAGVDAEKAGREEHAYLVDTHSAWLAAVQGDEERARESIQRAEQRQFLRDSPRARLAVALSAVVRLALGDAAPDAAEAAIARLPVGWRPLLAGAWNGLCESHADVDRQAKARVDRALAGTDHG